MDLTEKITIITGASSGIGLATARRFAQEGAHCVLAARRTDALEAVQQEIRDAGGAADVVTTDVSVKDQVYALITGTKERLGRVDILINNAGIGRPGRFAELSDDEVEQIVDTNFNGVLWGCRAAVPIMLAQDSGHIVNVSSINGLKALPKSVLYSATKFGVRGLSEGLRLELAGTGVCVSCVNPGFTDTPMTARTRERLAAEGRSVPFKAQDVTIVARTIRDAVVNNLPEVNLTASGRFLAGMNRVSPTITDWLIEKVL